MNHLCPYHCHPWKFLCTTSHLAFLCLLQERNTGSSSVPTLEDEALPPPPSELFADPPFLPPEPVFEEDDLPPPPYPGMPSQESVPRTIIPAQSDIHTPSELTHSQSFPQGLSGQVQNIAVNPVWAPPAVCQCGRHSSCDGLETPRKPCSKCKVSRKSSNSSTSSWGTDPSSTPHKPKPRVPPKLRTFQMPSDSGISSGSCSAHAPDSPTSTPRGRSRLFKHHKHRQRSRTCSPKSSRLLDETPEPRPVLCKKKKKGRKPRKSVTFSDNVALISSNEDKPVEIDYVKYVTQTLKVSQHQKNSPRREDISSEPSMDYDAMSLTAQSEGESSRSSTDLSGSRSSGQGHGYDSDLEVNSCSEDEDSDVEVPTDIVNKMRCGLCRKKWVVREQQYCLACGAYMAQFQPLKT